MSKVQLIITIENDEQADKVLAVLNEAEIPMEQDFNIDVERREIKTSPHLEDRCREVDQRERKGGSSYKTFHRTDHAHVCDNLVFGNRWCIQKYYTIGKDGEPMM